MNELHLDREAGHLILEDRQLRRGDYIDVQINDEWQRVRVDYHQEYKFWCGIARQSSDPQDFDHVIIIILRVGMIARLAPGRWSHHF